MSQPSADNISVGGLCQTPLICFDSLLKNCPSKSYDSRDSNFTSPHPSLYSDRSFPSSTSFPFSNPSSSALHTTVDSLKSARFLTTRTSAAFVRHTLNSLLSWSNSGIPSNASSLATLVFSSTVCILAITCSAALASGNCVAPTSSGETQDLVPLSPAVLTAWRKRTTVSAANKSPVPLKTQSMDGTSILNKRGERLARAVEPTMEIVDDEDEKSTEVMMMWGMR